MQIGSIKLGAQHIHHHNWKMSSLRACFLTQHGLCRRALTLITISGQFAIQIKHSGINKAP